MNESRRGRWLALIGLATLALLLGLLVPWIASGRMREAAAFPATAEGGSTVALSEAGKRVASGLKCPCGCPDLLLACNCGNTRGATEVKTMIMDLLRSGKTEQQVRVELINKYGAAIQRSGS